MYLLLELWVESILNICWNTDTASFYHNGWLIPIQFKILLVLSIMRCKTINYAATTLAKGLHNYALYLHWKCHVISNYSPSIRARWQDIAKLFLFFFASHICINRMYGNVWYFSLDVNFALWVLVFVTLTSEAVLWNFCVCFRNSHLIIAGMLKLVTKVQRKQDGGIMVSVLRPKKLSFNIHFIVRNLAPSSILWPCFSFLSVFFSFLWPGLFSNNYWIPVKYTRFQYS